MNAIKKIIISIAFIFVFLPFAAAGELINVAMEVNNINATASLITTDSILKNNKSDSKYHFYFLYTKLSKHNMIRLKKLISKNNITADFIYVDLDDLSKKKNPFSYEKINYEINEVLSGLFISDVLPEDMHKVLYLNSNLLVLMDLEKIYNTNITGYAAAMTKYLTKWSKYGAEMPDYYDTGIMLVNLDFYRKHKVTDKMYEYMRYYYFMDWDSAIINLSLMGNVKEVSIPQNFHCDLVSQNCYPTPPNISGVIHIFADKRMQKGTMQKIYKQYWKEVSPFSYMMFCIKNTLTKERG